MEIPTRRFANAIVARPVGRIDHATSGAVELALAPLVAEAGTSGGCLVLDFSALDYISSVGLRVLMVAAKQLREREAQLLVTALQSVVAEIFAISRFNRILSVTARLDEALALCSPQALAAYRSSEDPAGGPP